MNPTMTRERMSWTKRIVRLRNFKNNSFRRSAIFI